MDGEHRVPDLGSAPVISRRGLLRRGAQLTTAALGATFVGTASAQITTDAALPSSAPTMDGDDYTGLFVQVVNDTPDADTDGLDACPFFTADDTPAAYEIRLIDRIEEDRLEEESTLFAAASNEDVDNGKLFVINSQQSCSDAYVSVELEEIGASAVGLPSHPAAGEEVTAGVDDEETTATEADSPGLDVLTTMGAFVVSVLYVLRRGLGG